MKKFTLKTTELELNDEYEVIVVGGGPSGCSAAIASARRGAKTLLIEASGCLGGLGTMGLVPAWCPFTDKQKVIYRGIALEIFLEAKKGVPHANPDSYDWVPINPEHLKLVYDTKVIESGAEILFNTLLCAVDIKDGKVNAIIVGNKAGLSAYKAKVFIDCTGDGDLAYMAGAEVLPVDPKRGLQPATHCFEICNVDMKAYKEGQWLHGENPNSEMHKIVASGKYDIPDAHMCNNQVYNGTIGFNAGHIWNVDNTDPVSVSKALIKGRKMAHEIHRALVDYRFETFGQSQVSLTAPFIGARETRRILGDYVLNADDYIARRTFEDEICRNSYFLDVHHTEEEGKLINEGKLNVESRNCRYKMGESHGIPYRCLTPKGLKNVLIAGRSISTDRAVNGSIRVMPVCLCTGEAAGKAAVIAKSQSVVDVHSIDVNILRQQIVEDGGYIL